MAPRIDSTFRQHQADLQKAGYALPKYGADGKSGTETKNAIIKFQQDHHLTPTGKFDKDTLEVLDKTLHPKPQAPVQPAKDLKNEALKNDATLAAVSRGEVVLGKGAEGDGVKKLQEAMIKAGYDLKKFGADGDFGGETEAALKKIQTEAGLPATGKLDAESLKAVDKLSSTKVRYPEYDKLFKDGKLETTIAIGYDEDNWHVEQRRQIVEGLDKRGFNPVDVKTMSEADLIKNGIDPKRVDRDASYYVKTFQVDGKDVKSVVRLFDPNHPSAKKSFADAMANDEVVLYAGHARHGSGPDFDPIKKKDGNFVIGPTYDRGHVAYGENDLKKTKMTDDYQLMLFSACSTKNYLDELRSIPKNKDASNLDLFATTDEIYWGKDYTANVFTVLDGVMERQSVDQMKSRLETINNVPFVADGFRGNQYQPQ